MIRHHRLNTEDGFQELVQSVVRKCPENNPMTGFISWYKVVLKNTTNTWKHTHTHSRCWDVFWLACRAQEDDGWFPNKNRVWGASSRETRSWWWMGQSAVPPRYSAQRSQHSTSYHPKNLKQNQELWQQPTHRHTQTPESCMWCVCCTASCMNFKFPFGGKKPKNPPESVKVEL